MSHVYVPSEYMAAVLGLTPMPSAQRYAEVERYTNYADLRPYAVAKVIEGAAFTHRQKKRPPGWVSLWVFLQNGLKLTNYDGRMGIEERAKLLDALHTRAMSLALDEARTMPEAWGVDDPETHRYCTECMQVRLIEEFETKATCSPCFNKRRGL
jgi:hypothetical protein